MPAGPETSSRWSRLAADALPVGVASEGGRSAIAPSLEHGTREGHRAGVRRRGQRGQGRSRRGVRRIGPGREFEPGARLGDQAGLAAEAAERLVVGGVGPELLAAGGDLAAEVGLLGLDRRGPFEVATALVVAPEAAERLAEPVLHLGVDGIGPKGLAEAGQRVLGAVEGLLEPTAEDPPPRRVGGRGGARPEDRLVAAEAAEHQAALGQREAADRVVPQRSAAASRWGSASSVFPCISNASPLARRR